MFSEGSGMFSISKIDSIRSIGVYHQLQKNPSCSRFMIPFIGGPCHSIYTYWFGATFITSFSSPRPNRARIGGIHPLQTRFQRTNDWLEIQAVEVVSPIKKWVIFQLSRHVSLRGSHYNWWGSNFWQLWWPQPSKLGATRSHVWSNPTFTCVVDMCGYVSFSSSKWPTNHPRDLKKIAGII